MRTITWQLLSPDVSLLNHSLMTPAGNDTAAHSRFQLKCLYSLEVNGGGHFAHFDIRFKILLCCLQIIVQWPSSWQSWQSGGREHLSHPCHRLSPLPATSKSFFVEKVWKSFFVEKVIVFKPTLISHFQIKHKIIFRYELQDLYQKLANFMRSM